jgi:16S rRNA (cytosine967-C5)-methyltransferase
MTVSPARRAAFEILRRVELESAFASVLLATNDAGMSESDRALCHELVLGVLRRRLWLDKSIEYFASRPFEALDLPVRLALEIGLYQLRFLSRIPASAAVNESVNLVRTARVKSAATFVNAVLRRATRETGYDPASEIADPIEKVAVETSHPKWLIERWASSFGFHETESFAQANNVPPPTAFRFTPRAVAAEQTEKIFRQLAEAGAEITASTVVPNAWRSVGAQGAVRSLASAGLIYLQDEASQLIAHLLKVEKGHRVIDVAAAPGSKATHISMLAPHATIIAGDLYSHRASTMRGLAALQDAHIHTLIHDAARGLPFREASFDRVLLDSPCSGTGTLRRNPEIRWNLKPGDFEDLSSQQRAMLSPAAMLVRPGGRLIYSTCSVEVDENEAVVDAFLTGQRDFARIKLEGPAELLTPAGDIRTWPHRQGVDGFFVAVLERKP